MRGSVLILTLHIMVAISILLVTVFSIAGSHHILTISNNWHQQAYYLAESGMVFAQNELIHIIMQAHEECMGEFQWDPLRQPLYSLQESVGKHIESRLSPKINQKLMDMGYLMDFPAPILPELEPGSGVDVRIRFTDVYRNPSRLLITSRSNIGKIRRRIDAEICINKISNVYDSFLSDKVLITGNNLCIVNGGRMESTGPIHVQKGLSILNNSVLYMNGQTEVGNEVNIANGCQAVFNGEVICYGLHVYGENPSLVTCLGNLHCFGVLSASDSGNIIDVNSKLYINPEVDSVSAGVLAARGGEIQLNDEVYVNGTLKYQAEAEYLFGIEDISICGDGYHSSESIGGGNSNFYFPDFTPEYAYEIFNTNFNEKNRLEQGNIIYTYLTSPPDLEDQLNQYKRHLNDIDCKSIYTEEGKPLSGYTRGLVFANNQITEALQMEVSETFFHDLLLKMKRNISWDFDHHLNPGISVPLNNVLIDSQCLTVLNPEQPIVCIVSEEKDLVLLSGEYKGIIVTNGSIQIPPAEDVIFKGLMIAGGDLIVQGNLILSEDKNLIVNLLDREDDSLRRFFRIEKEKPLFEVISCKEVLYNAQW